MERVLEKALERCEAAEVYRVTSVSTPVQFENNQLKSIDTSESSGMALRVIKDGKLGFSSTTKPDDVDTLVDNALATAKFGPEAGIAFPGAGNFQEVDNFDATTGDVSVEDMVLAGEAVVDHLKSQEAAALACVTAEKSWVLRELVNSSGLRASHKSCSLTLFASAEIVLGENFLSVYDWAGGIRPPLDISQIKDRMAQKIQIGRNNVSLPTGKYPVIVTPLAMEDVIRPYISSINGRAVEKGFSPLKDRMGEKIADERFCIYDDPLLPGSIVARPFDSEGVVSRRLPLIEAGVLRHFQVDLKTAGALKTDPTGSAVRHSLESPPDIAPSCLVIEPGQRKYSEIVRGLKRGVIVDLLMGAWSGNPFGGVVNGNILLGFVVENGEIIGRLKNAMFSMNSFQAFQRQLAEISSDRLDYGNTMFPYILFDDINIVVKAE